MKGASWYGATIGFVAILLSELAPHPYGTIVLWSFFAVQLAWATRLTWVRLRLFFVSLSLAWGSAIAVMVVALYASGYDMLSFPLPWAVLFWSSPLMVPVLLYMEKFRNPEKWDAWADHMDDATAWDILRGHHIPDLEANRESRA